MALDFLSGEYYTGRVYSQIHHLQLLVLEQKRLLSPFGPRKFADILEKIIEVIRDFFSFELGRIGANNETEIINRSKKYLFGALTPIS